LVEFDNPNFCALVFSHDKNFPLDREHADARATFFIKSRHRIH